MHFFCISALGIAFDNAFRRPAREARGLTFGRNGAQISNIGRHRRGGNNNDDRGGNSHWHWDNQIGAF
jgi:hypothetical protein